METACQVIFIDSLFPDRASIREAALHASLPAQRRHGIHPRRPPGRQVDREDSDETEDCRENRRASQRLRWRFRQLCWRAARQMTSAPSTPNPAVAHSDWESALSLFTLEITGFPVRVHPLCISWLGLLGSSRFPSPPSLTFRSFLHAVSLPTDWRMLRAVAAASQPVVRPRAPDFTGRSPRLTRGEPFTPMFGILPSATW